ncbi:hypothetical protein [Paracoccus saliphilus]|uniref:Transposase n=1 Tax=Paracoccus saliphilus TaxID=405559 RepID=A0ABY7S2V7_9RHOB|nr:hypothetical protein [Paracoccus saliphilus]WCR01396.1 hypothetical protein JHX88_10565 [Paracoccus saliphilus]
MAEPLKAPQGKQSHPASIFGMAQVSRTDEIRDAFRIYGIRSHLRHCDDLLLSLIRVGMG